jgi:hypothetical protein
MKKVSAIKVLKEIAGPQRRGGYTEAELVIKALKKDVMITPDQASVLRCALGHNDCSFKDVPVIATWLMLLV